MARHAKNACSYSVFSAAERKRLTYGTQSRRVGGDAQKPFDHCEICLHVAEQPVICQKGHVYCRPCILESLAQQKEINKLAAQKYAQQQAQASAEAEAKEQKSKEAQRANFEKLEAALLRHGNTRTDANYRTSGEGGGGAAASAAAASSSVAAASAAAGSSSTAAAVSAASSAVAAAPAPAGYLRVETNAGTGFIVDRALVHSHTDAATDAREAQAQRKAYFPAFWMPSEAPADVGEAKMNAPPPQHCLCPAGSHPLKLKQLRPVRWHRETEVSAAETKATSASGATAVSLARFKPICFACKRTLDNRIPMMANLQCGHVVCKACVESLMIGKKATAAAAENAAASASASSSSVASPSVPPPAPRLVCVECEDPCSLADLVTVVAATGFASTGNTIAKAKLTPAFLC